MKYECSKERFLSDIEDHKMTIIKNDDLYRHVRFSRKGSSTYRFDLITWPGYLTITGDMGTWVFSRTEDMFDFFIMNENDFNHKNVINPSYWSEKIQSLSKYGGGKYEKFSVKLFEEAIKKYYNSWCEEIEDEDEKSELWEEIEEQVLNHIKNSDRDGVILYDKVYEFSYNDYEFQDFFEHHFEEYSFRYIWICYAIVWGIKEYRKEVPQVKIKEVV